MQFGDFADFVVLRRCAGRDRAEDYALVLTAKGLDSAILPDGRGYKLLVAPKDAIQASYELTAYDAENQQRPVRKRLTKLAPLNLDLLLGYWIALVFFFGASNRNAFSINWLEIGSAQTSLIRAGEWWRIVTALFLHANGGHLLNNLVFGTVFLVLLSQVLGGGMTALAVVAAGAAGNALNALVRPETHASIGASTAVFAAVGLLAAMKQDWRHGRLSSNLRDWAPLAAGIMLLAFLGFSEGQTDILAHVFGFVSGIALGAMLAWQDRPWAVDKVIQWKAAGAAVAIVVLAWLIAIIAG
jgi:membrane associated rhomboid family serine protease